MPVGRRVGVALSARGGGGGSRDHRGRSGARTCRSSTAGIAHGSRRIRGISTTPGTRSFVVASGQRASARTRSCASNASHPNARRANEPVSRPRRRFVGQIVRGGRVTPETLLALVEPDGPAEALTVARRSAPTRSPARRPRCKRSRSRAWTTPSSSPNASLHVSNRRAGRRPPERALGQPGRPRVLTRAVAAAERRDREARSRRMTRRPARGSTGSEPTATATLARRAGSGSSASSTVTAPEALRAACVHPRALYDTTRSRPRSAGHAELPCREPRAATTPPLPSRRHRQGSS